MCDRRRIDGSESCGSRDRAKTPVLRQACNPRHAILAFRINWPGAVPSMLPIYVVSLVRHTTRRARMAEQLDRFGLRWSFVDAIDRLTAPEAELAATFGHTPLSHLYPATSGDMACSLTHWRLWERIASEASGAALVLEDDARLGPSFADVAGDATVDRMRANSMDLLKIEHWPGPQASRRFPLGVALGDAPGGGGLYRLQSGFLGTCGYILTARGAAELRRRFRHIAVPVDHFLFGRSAALGFPLLRPGFVNPAPVLHDLAAFASDIGGDRPASGTRPLRRRLRDWRATRAERAEQRQGVAVRVEMRFSGD